MTYLLFLISYLLMLIGVLISVAFIILIERKVLGYIQLRKGPNKLGYVGILQSFSDAIKLFINEQSIPSYSNLFIYYVSPVFSFLVILLIWMLMPVEVNFLNMELGGIVFFCCASFGVYTLLGSGWSSNSSYAILGAMRGVAQTVSYEVSMALLFFSIIILLGLFNFKSLSESQDIIWLGLLLFPVFIMWFSSCLAETNRSPFDFAEGESELVSGFNIEYGSGGFALLFLAEYASIIFMSYLMVVLFMGGLSDSFFMFNVKGCFISFSFIWVRGTMPRFRYDKLMGLAWKIYLPLSLSLLLYYMLVGANV